MATIGIVGDGPGGLSAALFLAKADHDVTVWGTDGTVMNYAHLYNYLGIESIGGTEFQARARAHASSHGATLVDDAVERVTVTDGGFEVSTGDGASTVEYLVLSEGKGAPLAESLGLAADGEEIVVDRNGRSSVERVYVVGRSVRPRRSQAIISAGDGAAAALDILADIEGDDVQDWDSPPKD